MASPNTACDRRMLADVTSKVNSSYGHISAVPASSDRIKLSEIEQFGDGSYFGMSSLQQISKPLPENHIKLQSINRGMFVMLI